MGGVLLIALLIASERGVADHGLTPRARIHHLSVRGADPIWMLTAPIPATEFALKKTGMQLSDIDLVEINEAFASVVLAWMKACNPVEERLNPQGGAIALGHPTGATGARPRGLRRAPRSEGPRRTRRRSGGRP